MSPLPLPSTSSPILILPPFNGGARPWLVLAAEAGIVCEAGACRSEGADGGGGARTDDDSGRGGGRVGHDREPG
jgi:hypothetical protein